MTKNAGNFKQNLLSQRDIQKKVKELQESGKKWWRSEDTFLC